MHIRVITKICCDHYKKLTHFCLKMYLLNHLNTEIVLNESRNMQGSNDYNRLPYKEIISIITGYSTSLDEWKYCFYFLNICNIEVKLL